MDEQLMEIRRGNHRCAVGLELQLELRDFQSNGLGDVGGGGWKEDEDRQQRDEGDEIET
jgi:hypothetical protein